MEFEFHLMCVSLCEGFQFLFENSPTFTEFTDVLNPKFVQHLSGPLFIGAPIEGLELVEVHFVAEVCICNGNELNITKEFVCNDGFLVSSHA